MMQESIEEHGGDIDKVVRSAAAARPNHPHSCIRKKERERVTAVNITPQTKYGSEEAYSNTLKPIALVDDTRLYVVFPDLGQRVLVRFLFAETYIGVNLQIAQLPSDQQLLQSLRFPPAASQRPVFPPTYLKYSFGKLRINPTKETTLVKRKDNVIIASAPLISQHPLIVNRRQLMDESPLPSTLNLNDGCYFVIINLQQLSYHFNNSLKPLFPSSLFHVSYRPITLVKVSMREDLKIRSNALRTSVVVVVVLFLK